MKTKTRHALMIIVITMLLCLMAGSQDRVLGMSGNPIPTVTVVDTETGEPIEGAVAIAIWRKHSIIERAWWEGGTMVVVKIEEAVSDKDGNIYIDGFWGWYMSGNRYPRLTIYKPGYICWDQNNLYEGGLRTDFDKDHRIARMEKWPEGFSFVGHEGFIYSCTYGDYNNAPKQLFSKAIQTEIPYRIKERAERDKKKREIKEEKNRREGQ